MFIFIILILFGLLLWYLNRRRKKLVIQTVNVITGAPKTGKTLLAVKIAIKEVKKRRLKTYIYNFFHKNKRELPLLYTNAPIKYPYVKLTEDLLLRRKRFNYRSVILIQEAYNVADSMSYNDLITNDNLSLLTKLIGHETRGGCMILETQNVHDLHFAFKRCATSYIYIMSNKKIPFFINLKCRELINSDEVHIVNTSSDDIQDDPSFHNLWIGKWWFKKYDCYCYSALTDYLEVDNNVITDFSNLKTTELIRLGKVNASSYMKGGYKNERKN